MENYFQSLISNNRHFNVWHDTLDISIISSPLYKNLISLFNRFVSYHNLDITTVAKIYLGFLKEYKINCNQFADTNKYPPHLNGTIKEINRVEYDLILILSALFTEHRFEIMNNVSNLVSSDTLLIGIGPGIELLALDKSKKIDAFDLSISKWVKEVFPNINFHECLYTFEENRTYDSIVLIEILEHLDNPYELLETCFKSLNTNGILKLTTASNIPQFDHKFNFPVNHEIFEKNILEIGYKIRTKIIIKHKNMEKRFKSFNHFYLLEKANYE